MKPLLQQPLEASQLQPSYQVIPLRWMFMKTKMDKSGGEEEQRLGTKANNVNNQDRLQFVLRWLKRRNPCCLTNPLICKLLIHMIYWIHFMNLRWSFGCLLAEVLSGTKMFSATDKMASVLKPHQLVEMRLGSTEIKYHEIQQDSFFKDAKDLISRYVHILWPLYI